MKLSIVTTLYYSAPYIKEFYERINPIAKQITSDFEIIFVNDGSPDNSLEVSLLLHERDKNVKVIDLSRNFGHHKAIMTGLAYSQGDIVFLIDSDLEEEPELLKVFWDELIKDTEADVIYGTQKVRKGKSFERLSGFLFYKIFNLFSNFPIPENLLTVRIMKKNYIQALIKFKENELFFAGVSVATGFKQKSITIKKHSNSPTTYNLSRKLALVVNSITSFSSKPLEYIFYTGSMISFISFFYIIYIVSRKIFGGISVIGWASLIASIWMIGGLLMLSIGILGIYLSKIFYEVKNRPYTIVKTIYEK